jgi:NNP family nitrate/nitrite transporter-like MFS transporter
MATQPDDRIAVMEEELKLLHSTLQRMGKNSQVTTDVFGRRFQVPVDAEHKATEDPLLTTLLNCSNPHMRAFHTSWFGFFSSFYSTFAAASLFPYITPDLGLTKADKQASGSAAVGGTIVFRLIMGWICDKFGARRGLGFLLLGCTPAIVVMMFVQGPIPFILCRCVIGFSLATFVACQTWCSQMFSKQVVGIANATAAGWGNLGGGVTNLTMPYVFLIVCSFVNYNFSTAWRLSYFVPLAFHVVGGLAVLTARDLPDGNYAELEKIGAKQKANSGVVLKVGCSNINAIILTLTYGMCFGIELTMNNVAAGYFYEYQGLSPQLSGLCASCWGLMNIIARSMGGWLSDWANAKAGMRGRLWACWIVQTLEGVFCILLGSVTTQMGAPHKDSVGAYKSEAWTYIQDDPTRTALNLPNGWINLNTTCGTSGTEIALTIDTCDTLVARLDEPLRNCLKLPDYAVSILRKTAPPDADPGNPALEGLNCVSNSGSVGQVMLLVVCFSMCVQMAEGLHYGIVPYVSRQALGVVSGMVGAGGNLGAVIAGQAFFRGWTRTDQGIVYMGIMIIAETALLFLVYFPEHGSMLFKAGSLPYDPQIIKPPADYRGSDSMDYEAAKKNQAAQAAAGGEVTVSKA